MEVCATIYWNTGDDYWDNIPEDEVFTGTFEELCEYLEATESERDELWDLFISQEPNWSVFDCEEITWEVFRIK